MARMTAAQLQEEIDRLAAENAALRLEQQDQLSVLASENAELRVEMDELRSVTRLEVADAIEEDAIATSGRRSRWWTVLSVCLIVIGLVLAPAAVVANWAANELTDTDRFVATFAPLADDPAVQAYVADEIVTTIDANLDVEGITDQVFDGIDSLGLPPAASNALKLLRKPAVSGINSLIDITVNKFVKSQAFSDTFAQTLRITHGQLNATLAGDPNATVSISRNGEIGIELGPIIAQVKTALVNNGLTFAQNLPAIDKTIVVAQSDRAATLQTAYGLGVAAGAWLPWVSLAFLVAGALVARRRLVTLLATSISLAIIMILLGSGLRIGRIIFIASLSPLVMPTDAAGSIYDAVVRFVDATILAVAVLAITVAVVTWLSSSYRVPVALRSIYGGWMSALRRAGEARGVTTGRFGAWLYRQRVLVRVAIGVIAAAVILFVRPLTPAEIVWTAVIALVLLGVSELLQRPVIVVPEEAEEDTPVVVG